jgi:acetate---CoA ligase (ADP-forming)
MSLQPVLRPQHQARPDLSRFLNPRGVAVVGASNDLSRIGGQPLKLLTEFGYRGKVYPVNPKYREVKGLACYPDLTQVPQPCDVALIALSAQHVPGVIEQSGVPCILAPGRAVRAMAAVTEFACRHRASRQRPKSPSPRLIARQPLDPGPAVGALGEHRSKTALAVYGVPVVKEVLLAPPEIESLQSLRLRPPFVVKIESPDIPHKTEAGVVRLNLRDLDAVKQAAHDVLAAARGHKPDARIDGVLVQEMATGLEVIVGAMNDPCFGPTVAFGLGGIYTELMKDVTHRFAPFDASEARGMIMEIEGAALFAGFRGRPALDVPALADTLARVSLLIADHADRIAEIDVNPLFVREAGKGVVAADALIVLKQS